MEKINFEGREYSVVEVKSFPNTAAHLQNNGWDGMMYLAESKPSGRQRKAFWAMFYKSAKTGEFVKAA